MIADFRAQLLCLFFVVAHATFHALAQPARLYFPESGDVLALNQGDRRRPGKQWAPLMQCKTIIAGSDKPRGQEGEAK